MNRRIPFLLIALASTALVLPAGATSEGRDTEAAESEGAEFEQLIHLERAVHFLTPTGEDAVVPPGSYSVESDDGALRLISDDEQTTQPITIDAHSMTHEEALETAQPVSTTLEEDKHVVALLLPKGTGMQAVGSYSGVFSRVKLPAGWLKGLPVMNGILTTPRFGTLQENHFVTIKGKNFGPRFSKRRGKGVSQGMVVLQGYFKEGARKKAYLRIREWSATNIKATVAGDALNGPLRDQKVKIQVMTASGKPSPARRMPLRAARTTKWLSYTSKGVTVRVCSDGGDANLCNGRGPTHGTLHGKPPLGPVIPSTGLLTKPPKFEITPGEKLPCGVPPGSPAIWGRHKNTDMMVDTDDGTDKYTIKLVNGWVLKCMYIVADTPGDSWIRMPRKATVEKYVYGTSEWKPEMRWKIDISESIVYAYWVQIEGPKGIPHDRFK